jgi:signal peptidase I
MFSTVILFALLLGLLLASLVLWALLLYLGLRWAKIKGITIRRVVSATAAAFAVHLLLGVLAGLLSPSTDRQVILVSVAQLAASALLPCLIIAYTFTSRFLRSVQAWAPTLVSPIAMAVFVLLIVRPFLVEAFLIPTNAMAPTLVGSHVKGICPECSSPTYASLASMMRYRASTPRPQICENFHISRGVDFADRAFTGDRVVVAKFMRPRRWDLVVFRKPQDPSILHVTRLVGLPGEEIHLDDGAVWANGSRLRPPESISKITYLSELPKA